METAIQSAYGLQTYREEYNILDTYEDGRNRLRRHVELFPQQWLSFGFSHSDDTYVFMHDIHQLDMSLLTTPRRAEDWFASCYYIHTVLCPDFTTIRKGAIVCVECMESASHGSRRKIEGKMILQMMSELLAHYPCRFVCKNYHTGVWFNLFISSVRKLLPPEFKDMYQVGCQFDGHLGEAMLVPTVNIANQRMLGQLEQTLRRRYDNEKSFRLNDK